MNLFLNLKSLIISMCILSFAMVEANYWNSYPDYPGQYCQKKGCCHERQDNCSVPIADTLCYCDDFCDRTHSGDCCPDYKRTCGPPQLITCLHKRRTYQIYDTFRDNCNHCTCLDDGRVQCEQNTCLQDEAIINNINSISHSNGWAAKNYSEFWGRTFDEGLRHRLGTLPPRHAAKSMRRVTSGYHKDLPRQFNSLEHWPHYISEVRDQGWCGSSWVLSTTSVASDRYAIQSKGYELVELSPQHILCCAYKKPRGCEGGHLDTAWRYLLTKGVVSEDCYPYRDSVGKCPFAKKKNLTFTEAGCYKRHQNEIERKSLYTMGPVYLLGNETDIMNEILISGPVQATLKVHRDFFSYGSGIYKHSAASRDEQFGYHSVRLVGWGEEYDAYNRVTKYWIAANSWGTWWGEHGYFRIRRGSNECGIEEFVLASWAQVYVKETRTIDYQKPDYY